MTLDFRPRLRALAALPPEWGMGMFAATIEGGWVQIPAGRLLAAWQAVGTGPFRAYMGLAEMDARRRAGKAAKAAYGPAELAGLLGVSIKRARTLAGSLVGAGLVRWCHDSIVFLDPASAVDDALAATIGGGRGNLIIPRRLLRWLAKGAKASTIATALGALLRCLSRRRDGFDSRGRIKSSFVASLFGVAIRRVKAARAELIALGWLAPEPVDQWASNRWGRAFSIDLGWSGKVAGPATPGGSRSAHPIETVGPEMAHPCLDPDPLPGGIQTQEPASGGRTGVEGREHEKPVTPPAKHAGDPAEKVPAPTLADIRPEDLADTARTLELHRQAVERGIIPGGEAGRIRFVSAAAHAMSVGTVNAPGLFASIVRNRRWALLTQRDEDAAVAKLRDHDRGMHGNVHAPSRPDHARRPYTPEASSPEPTPPSLGSLLMNRFAAFMPGGEP